MKAKTPVIVLTIFAVLLAVVVFVYISRARPSAYAFSNILAEVDLLIENGERAKALSLLERARKRTVSSVNWLSIAKREIALLDFAAAEESLHQALELFPANDRLSAVLVYLFVQEGRIDDAVPFLPFLAGTEFVPLAAYAEIALDAPDFSLSGETGLHARSSAYTDAWRFTGNPVFRRDAAVLYTLAGDYSAASSTYVIVPEATTSEKAYDALPNDRLFRALLAYDDKAFSAVPGLLEFDGSAEGLTTEEALLTADALFLDDNEDAAALIWKSLFESDVTENPLIFFNRALTAHTWPEKRTALEKCLELFPAYYPALAVYVRSALSADSPVNYFPFYEDDFSAKALAETLHVSQGMEEALLNRPVSLPDAENALRVALDASSNENAFRLQIELENVRFLCFQKGKDTEARHVLWNILEKYSGNNLAEEFALWFFAKQADFDVFFELAGNFETSNPLYAGIVAAAGGSLNAALECFNSAAGTPDEWAALADTAVVLKKQGAYSDSADYFALAADLAADETAKSRLYYQTALVFEQQKAYRRAADMLRHAVSLDEGNYSARAMLRRLEAEQGL